eukprot:g4443.t1
MESSALSTSTASAAGASTPAPAVGIEGLSKPRFTNVVATYDFKMELDLKHIAMNIHNTEYSPKRFAAVIIRVRMPVKATGLIFSTGKMVCTGTTSKKSAVRATNFIQGLIRKVVEKKRGKGKVAGGGKKKYKFSEKECKIQNMSAIGDVRFPIRLEGLAIQHKDFSTYEPEIFPGLIYRMRTPVKLVVLVFASGKIVITGAKKEEDVVQAIEWIYPVLDGFNKYQTKKS